MSEDWGMKVSEDGHDVKTAEDINLALKTDLTMLKAVLSGSVALNGNQEISHNLGYVPQFLVYVWDGSKCRIATGHKTYGYACADTTKLYILDTGTSAKYYILYEPA